jgi:glycine oxidase
MHDCLIIGGGVIGLSLAWDLARHGKSVHVIDQQEPGQAASWAGAGLIPAASSTASKHPFEQMRGLACELHPRLAAELKELTGIYNGYRRCGGLHLARTPGEAAALSAWADTQRDEGLEVLDLDAANLYKLEPGMRPKNTSPSPQPLAPSPLSAVLLPAEAQLRNPRHLKALLAACEKSHVTISPNVAVHEYVVRGDELIELQTTLGPLRARQYCFTAGAWTGQILQRLGIVAPVLPIRGQMVLFRCERPPVTRIVNEGSRYVVPRDDGRVLAGSTEEEVGFDTSTTEEAIADLTAFARGLVPALAAATIENTWAGLRPASFDGMPYMGRIPGLKNAFVSAGHFRSGLYLSAPAAMLMSQLIRGEPPQIDLAPFRVGR